jgi:hypothetical protein
LSDLVVRTKLARYLALREEVKHLKKEMEDTRDELVPYIQSSGRENAAGSKVLALDNPMKMGEAEYLAVQYTRKSSKIINEEKALEYLTSDAAFETALDTSPRVDQDGLWDLYVNDMIPQDVFDSFFEEKVSWAFNPIAE